MKRLAGASRLLRIRRARNSARCRSASASVALGEAAFDANRERLHRFIVARGASADADEILQAVRLAASSVDFDVGGPPSNAMFRMADRLIAARSASSRLRGGRAAASEETALVEGRLEALGDRVATVFRRHRIDGLPQRAIARELGIDLAAVQSDLCRAYAALVDLRASSFPASVEQP